MWGVRKKHNLRMVAKFRLKLKKVGKTTRPFRYDLNQIPCDYTVEVRNIFKGLDLIDRVPDELWNKVCDIVQSFSVFGCKEYNQSDFGVDKDGEALYSQQKQDWELTVAQIMSSLSPNSDLN